MRLFHGALVLSILLACALHAAAQNAKDVNVANTPNVNVVNNPGVQVTNTPSVNVSNTPNVNVVSVPAVQVTNTLNGDGKPAPVITRDADQPIRIPFRGHGTLVLNAGTNNLTGFNQIPIPDGDRVEIQFVTAVCTMPSGSGVAVSTLTLTMAQKDPFAGHSYPLVVHVSGAPDAFGRTTYLASQAVTAYADGAFGNGIGLGVFLSAGSPGVNCDLEVTGFKITP